MSNVNRDSWVDGDIEGESLYLYIYRESLDGRHMDVEMECHGGVAEEGGLSESQRDELERIMEEIELTVEEILNKHGLEE